MQRWDWCPELEDREPKNKSNEKKISKTLPLKTIN